MKLPYREVPINRMAFCDQIRMPETSIPEVGQGGEPACEVPVPDWVICAMSSTSQLAQDLWARTLVKCASLSCQGSESSRPPQGTLSLDLLKASLSSVLNSPGTLRRIHFVRGTVPDRKPTRARACTPPSVCMCVRRVCLLLFVVAWLSTKSAANASQL